MGILDVLHQRTPQRIQYEHALLLARGHQQGPVRRELQIEDSAVVRVQLSACGTGRGIPAVGRQQRRVQISMKKISCAQMDASRRSTTFLSRPSVRAPVGSTPATRRLLSVRRSRCRLRRATGHLQHRLTCRVRISAASKIQIVNDDENRVQATQHDVGGSLRGTLNRIFPFISELQRGK